LLHDGPPRINFEAPKLLKLDLEADPIKKFDADTVPTFIQRQIRNQLLKIECSIVSLQGSVSLLNTILASKVPDFKIFCVF
jgi:hypothetical protein